MREGHADLNGPRRTLPALALLVVAFAGCVNPEPVRSTSWLGRIRPFQGTPNVVTFDVALLELRPNDPFINGELWNLADESAVDLEKKGILEDNGFRIGQVGGLTPRGLAELLKSEQSCANPRRIQMKGGKTKELLLGPPQAVCDFELRGQEATEAVSLEQGQCQLTVVPTPGKNGQVVLRCTPQVRYGETRHVPWAVPEEGGYLLQPQKPTRAFPELAWEVTLAPDEYVVIGARTDRPGTLGYHCFVRPDERPAVQRVLVLRAGPMQRDVPPEGVADAETEERLQRCPPVAAQASWSTARGSGH
jgi:hypothetical protein